MVKLRVIVRVLPETEYLAYSESIAASQGPIRGEKKFHVVIQEPEKWYIGTLAVAVKQKYQNLYKHDLGQIKYLKNDEDDCDLDPEEVVADILVNEGKALTDRSDQTVTIKVIREQGRAIRQGSVIPDLTPIHYQLPTRPPVPRFENLQSSLGKRIADSSAVDTEPSKRKRSTLSEIEENGEIASSIERDPTMDIVIENSQPTQSQIDKSVSSNSLYATQEPSWSFSEVGPPLMIEATVPQQSSVRNGSGDVGRTPSVSPVVGGSSSARKRFLKPTRDLYAYPESDIDDSLATTRSPQRTKITPRLVSNRSNELVNTSKPSIAGGNLAQGGHDFSSTGTDKISTNSSNEKLTQTTKKRKQARKSSSTVQPSVAVQGTSVDQSSTNHTNAPKPKSFAASLPHEHTKKDQTNSTNDSLGVSSTQAKRKRRRSKATDASTQESGQKQERQLSTPPPDSPSEQLSHLLQESAKKHVSTALSQMTYPDGIQAQSRAEGPKSSEAALKSSSEDASSQIPSPTSSGRLGLGITDSPRKPRPVFELPSTETGETRVISQAKRPKKAAKLAADLQKGENSVKSVREESRTAAKLKSAATKRSVPTAANESKAASPNKAANSVLERAQSTESNATKGSNVILPPGMSKVEFDRIIANNAHLNLEPKKTVAKRKSTPSMRKSISRSLDVDNTTPVVPDKGDTSSSTSGAPIAATGAIEKSAAPKFSSVDVGSTDKQDNAASGSLSISQPHQSLSSERIDSIEAQAKPTVKSSEASEKEKKTASRNTPRPSKAASVAASNLSDQSGSNKRAINLTETAALRNVGNSTPSVSSKSGSTSKNILSTPSKSQTSMAPPGLNEGPPKKTAMLPKTATSPNPKSVSNKIKSDSSTMVKQDHLTSTSTSKQNKAAATTAFVTQARRPPLAGPDSIYSARSLKELARLSGSTHNSPTTSTVASPALTTQHRTSFLGKSTTGANKTKALFGNINDDSSSSDNDDDSSSDSSSPPDSGRVDKHVVGQIKTPAGKASSQATNAAKGRKTIMTPLVKRPDPTIRDTSLSVDDDSGSESSSNSGGDSDN